MLRDLLVLLTVWPAIVREALDPLPDDEQFAVAAALEVDAEACLAMLAAPDAVTPFGPAANLCRRLLDLVDDMPPATAARLQ